MSIMQHRCQRPGPSAWEPWSSQPLGSGPRAAWRWFSNNPQRTLGNGFNASASTLYHVLAGYCKDVVERAGGDIEAISKLPATQAFEVMLAHQGCRKTGKAGKNGFPKRNASPRQDAVSPRAVQDSMHAKTKRCSHATQQPRVQKAKSSRKLKVAVHVFPCR